MNTHVIFQTASFNFFNSLRFKSIAWLELIKNDVNFVYVDTAKTTKYTDEAITKIGAIRWCLGHAIDDERLITYTELRSEIYAYLDNVHNLKTVSLYNGHTDIHFEDELNRYEYEYMLAKGLPNVPLFKVVKKPYVTIVWAIAFIIMEYCAEHDVVVYNIWEDPLQHKFSYIANLNIRHYYFHSMPNMTYNHPSKTNKQHPFNFEFCPSQQYWYMLCQNRTRGIVNIHDEHTYKFVFAMTDNWAAMKDRQNLILKLEHMADPNFVNETGILFRYSSNRTKTIYKYNKPVMPYELYMECIKHSKFTMIIPSYDVNCFSLRRFFEALSNGCIPLILDTCNYEHGFNLNAEFIAIVKKYLLISEKDLYNFVPILNNKIEQYTEILDAIKSSVYWKTYSNPKLYLKYVKRLYI